MKKIMLVFGTRPEGIKMCPLVNELKRRPQVQTVVCVTGQHKQMLQQVLDAFSVVPDYDLAIMQPNQTLFDVTTAILTRIQAVLNQEKPDLTLVHGDTSTAFVTALACFYLHIPVGHVEAGLRTYNLESPFPEEFNRQAVSLICRYHFAPTEKAKQNPSNPIRLQMENPKIAVWNSLNYNYEILLLHFVFHDVNFLRNSKRNGRNSG